jgi:hypothetical protein
LVLCGVWIVLLGGKGLRKGDFCVLVVWVEVTKVAWA